MGAAAQIRGSILALRDAGCAVLVVSEELDELFEICDRLHVVAKGHLSPSVARADATVERIGEWMSGLWHADVQAHLSRDLSRDPSARYAPPTQSGEAQHV
ncbi:L-arabinose transporter ATP-binding protein [compost metagenome]